MGLGEPTGLGFFLSPLTIIKLMKKSESAQATTCELILGCNIDQFFTCGLLNLKSLLEAFQVNLAQTKMVLSPP
jgi:hypothetical protein